jgi:hypothetical protein
MFCVGWNIGLNCRGRQSGTRHKNADPLGQRHKFRDRLDLHLLHHLVAMGLDGALGRAPTRGLPRIVCSKTSRSRGVNLAFCAKPTLTKVSLEGRDWSYVFRSDRADTKPSCPVAQRELARQKGFFCRLFSCPHGIPRAVQTQKYLKRSQD